MSSKNQEESEKSQQPLDQPADKVDDDYLLSCSCESAKTVSTLLSCLKHIGSSAAGDGISKELSSSAQNRRRSAAPSLQPVTVFCSPASLTFHVYGKSKQMQASVDIQSSLFSDYSVSIATTADDQPKEEWQAGGGFCVNLSSVLECLHCLGTHSLDKTKLCFSYNATQEIFKMELLEESGVLITSAIPGMVPPDDDLGTDSLALAFRSSPIVARIIVKSETLQDLVSELELVAGGTVATVLLGADGLEMNVVGHLGECTILLPAKGNHIVSVEITSSSSSAAPPARVYPLHALTESMLGLEIAEETCITINDAGMMAIQHQVIDRTLSIAPSFVDFILCCMQDEDDDDESEAAASPERTSPRSSARSQAQDVGSATSRSSVRVVSQGKMSSLNDGDSANFDDDNEDESKTDGMPLIRTRSYESRLFGSVVGEDCRQSSPRAPSRQVRRRTRPPLKKRPRAVASKENSPLGDGSRDLLAGSGDDVESDQREDTEPLDVTALASPRRRRFHREDECSSPELVYGQQH